MHQDFVVFHLGESTLSMMKVVLGRIVVTCCAVWGMDIFRKNRMGSEMNHLTENF